MPASERSARITDAYRQRLFQLQANAATLSPWSVSGEDIDGTGHAWIDRTVPGVQVVQHTAVALTAGYLAAYVAAERGRVPGAPPPVDDRLIGKAQDGEDLAVSLAKTLITVKVALKAGRSREQALELGRHRADRLIADAVTAAPREALHSGMLAVNEIIGWRRVTRGGCGACLAAADNVIRGEDEPLRVHPHCHCTAEPVLDGAPDTFQRPTGRETFDGMTFEQQAALLGEEKAALIRSGQVPFERLIQPQPMAVIPDGITEAPLEALV